MNSTATPRPTMGADFDELYDTWLTPNGVEGWMPENATVTVTGGQIRYSHWRHLDPASSPWDKDVMVASDLWKPGEGHDAGTGGEPVVDRRTVPLAVPVTDRVRELCRKTGLNLVEKP